MKAKPFYFKQFTVHQDQSALKVGTDGVLLGAWTNCNHATSILDIGSGTGVVSLMLAQRCTAKITAIEIEADAAKQSEENFQNSVWSKRLLCLNDSIQHYSTSLNAEKFDLIVSNPPFYSIQKETTKRSTARSEQELNVVELLQCVSQLLAQKGKFSLIFPSIRKNELMLIAEQVQLFPSRICYIKGNAKTEVKRILVEFGFEPKIVEENHLIIEKERHHYTEEYQALLQPYLTIF